MGAATLAVDTSAVYRVIKAAVRSSLSAWAQNRGRLRRTYQLLISSTKSWRARAASGTL